MVHDVINEDQTGFLKGRYIGENVRLLLDLMNETSEQNIPGLIMFCDLQQAYDHVSWEYLIKAIDRFQFGPSFRRWISMLYSDSADPVTARITMNGCLSRSYCIQRGLRQGCPLSCLLFLICIEPFGQTIRASSSIVGIKVNGLEIKMSAYADDTALILDGSENSLRAALKICEDFEGVSGLKLNKSKTNVMWIGGNKYRRDSLCEDCGLNWTRQVNYLGVEIGPLLTNMAEYNYAVRIRKLKNLLNPWVKRGITPFGRLHLIKSMALSQLVYLMSVLEKPCRRMLKELETIMFNFIWNGKRDRIKRSTMKNLRSAGGLQVPDPSTQADSLKVTWIKRFMNGDNHAKWKRLLETKFLVGRNLVIFECKLSRRALECKLPNKFWRETYLAWRKIAESEMTSDESRLNEAMWLNRDLNLEDKKGIPKKQLCNKGVLRINDIYNGDARRLMTVSELNEKYNFGNFLSWHAILKSIPREWKEGLYNRKPSPINDRAAVYQTLREKTKIAKWAYPLLLATDKLSCPIKAQTKWENELRGNQQISWPEAYKSLYACTRDVKLKWLQLRVLHRILPTNKLLYLMGKKDTRKCERCSEPNEDFYHVFWGCNQAQNFWVRLQRKLSLLQPFTPQKIILGLINSQGTWSAAPLRMCILLGKQFIWQERWSGRATDVDNFTDFVKQYVSVERCIVARSGGIDRFNDVYGKLSEVLGV